MKGIGLAAAFRYGVCAAGVTFAFPLAAQAQEYTRSFSIPPGSLKRALELYTRQSGVELIYRTDELAAIQSLGVNGVMTRDAALTLLLRGTGFTMQRDTSGALAIIRVRSSVSPVSPPNHHLRKTQLTAPVLDQEAEGPEEIIVTARRFEERLQDVPISMTVYNQDAITERNIVNTADLAIYTPSLSVNSRYGPEKASFAIRGFVQDFQTAPSVGTYFADVVGPRASSTTTAGNGVGIGHLFDLQNVQVLKGPQGTLFGRNTTGGAVLLVPNKPSDKLEGYVEGTLGNYDMRRIQAVVNVPLADTFKVRLGVDRMKRDGYLKNRSGVGPARMANTDYISARVSIVANLTENLESYTIATYSDSDNHGTTPRLVGCKRTGPFTGLQDYGSIFGCAQIDRQIARGDGWWDIENSEASPRVHQEAWQAINTTTWQVGDTFTIKNIVSYAEHREDTSLNLAGDNFVGLAPVVLIYPTPGFHYGAQSTFTEELQLKGAIESQKLNWQAGGYLEISDPINFSSQSSPLLLNCTDFGALQCRQGISVTVPLPTGPLNIPISNLGQPFYKMWWRSQGLYAQGTYQFDDKLAATAGLRYTWDEQRHYQAGVGYYFFEDNVPTGYCSNSVRNPGPDGPGSIKFIMPKDFRQCDLEFTAKSSKPTWTIDLEYKPSLDLMLFAKWSRGYRAGGVNTPYVFFETWNPEKVDTYEMGAKASFRGPISGYFNVTGFYNNFRDQQIQATLTGKVGAPVQGGTGTVNAGKSRIWGIEVDTAATLFERLRLDAGYTYLSTKLLKLTNIPPADDRPWMPGDSPWSSVNPTAREGAPLSLSPKHRLQVTGSYTFPIDETIGEMSIGATYVHTSSQIASIGTLTEFGILPATDLLNLNARWKGVMGQPVDLAFFMTNALNKRFPVNVANFYSSFGYEAQMVNEPRMWGVRLKYNFGE